MRARLSSLQQQQHSLSEEEASIGWMGENVAEGWHSDLCPATLKKKIFRTVVEEIIVRTDAKKETLEFNIHWKGGAHSRLEMERPAAETATSMEALEIVQRMVVTGTTKLRQC